MSNRKQLAAAALLLAPMCLGSAACAPNPEVGENGRDLSTPSPRLDIAVDGDQATRRALLEDVDNWLYLLDSELNSATVEQIANSDYEMVVIDFVTSEVGNLDFPMADVVSEIQGGDPEKLVLAYIDIGQAESYRSYWQDGWEIGNPAWIVGDDPDGWQDNYPVAYWNNEWQTIWIAEKGIISDIINAGFNGIYLDWVEAYSDENVLDIADKDEVDAQQEMINWVGHLAQVGRQWEPEFLVVAQNAPELLEDAQYISIIDAVAQEQVWFDGGADNNPPGDCPLPRTEEAVDTPAYRQSLSPACEQQYERYPDGTLHVSSEYYLDNLTRARTAGLVVLTVDYALNPENITWIYETSRSNGFIPFVSNRALDTMVYPVQ